MAKTTYRMCGGLAVMPGHDMAMLKRMSAKGWHVTGVNRALLYRFERGEPHGFDYAVDFQRDFSEEARELYGLGGWEPVVLGPGWQIVRAEAGTTPLYTDDDAEAETLRESRKGLGLRALRAPVTAFGPGQRAGVVGLPRGVHGPRGRVRLLALPLRRVYAFLAQDPRRAGGGPALLTCGPIWDTLFRLLRKEPAHGIFR